MPNHCCNSLIMSKATLPVIIKNYIRKNEKGEKIFDFELIEPVGDVPDWYEKRWEKWGTKWIGYSIYIGESFIDFYTAWGPPTPIIKKLAELHKDLIFRLEYYEAGTGFQGITTAKWQDGKVLFEDNYWDMTDKEREEIGIILF